MSLRHTISAGIRWAAALTAVVLLAGAALAEDVPVPELKARVTDLAGTLTTGDSRMLTDRLARIEQDKGAQIAILIVPTTGAEAIEQFATRVFDRWRLGRKGIDDGILILLATDDRAMRIEVGRGLEGLIPDVVAGRLIREQATPAFQQGFMRDGLVKTVFGLDQFIASGTLPETTATPKRSVDWLLWASLALLNLPAIVIRTLAARRGMGFRKAMPLTMAVSGGILVAWIFGTAVLAQSDPALKEALLENDWWLLALIFPPIFVPLLYEFLFTPSRVLFAQPVVHASRTGVVATDGPAESLDGEGSRPAGTGWAVLDLVMNILSLFTGGSDRSGGGRGEDGFKGGGGSNAGGGASGRW